MKKCKNKTSYERTIKENNNRTKKFKDGGKVKQKPRSVKEKW